MKGVSTEDRATLRALVKLGLGPLRDAARKLPDIAARSGWTPDAEEAHALDPVMCELRELIGRAEHLVQRLEGGMPAAVVYTDRQLAASGDRA